MKPVPTLAIMAAIAAVPIIAHADDIETEHLFGFTIGSDIGQVGEKEVEGGTTARLGKRTGSYSAVTQTLSLEYVPAQNFRVELTAAGARHDIAGVQGLDDRRQSRFDGLAFDMRYGLLDRAHAPFGLAIDAEPHFGRVDETSGEPVDRYGIDFAIALDKELVPNRIVAALNLLYMPEASRSRLTGAWSRQATLGLAHAIMLQVRPDIFVGVEARYLRSYNSLDLGQFAGHALFLGPTVFAKLSERAWIAAAWNTQLAGRSVGAMGSLDVTNFERHQATLKFGVNF